KQLPRTQELSAAGQQARPRRVPTQPKARREAIDDEFRQRRVAAVELVRVVHGGRGYRPIGKTAPASRRPPGLGGRARASQGAQGLRPSPQPSALDPPPPVLS